MNRDLIETGISNLRASLCQGVIAMSMLVLPVVVLAQKQAPDDKPAPPNSTAPLTKQQEEQAKLQQDADQKIKELVVKLDRTRRTDARMQVDEFGAICKRALPPEVYTTISGKVLKQCVNALSYEHYQCAVSRKKSCAGLS